MTKTEWEEGGLNYIGQRVDSRVETEYVYDTKEERAEGMEKISKEIGYTCWGVWDRKIDGETKYFFAIHETKLVNLPTGYVLDFPWVEAAFNHDSIIDQIIYDPEIDRFIEDLLIKFNKAGIKTFTSCSGLVEDHIEVVPYDETGAPFIMFEDFDDLKKVAWIIANTSWNMEVRSYLHAEHLICDFNIHNDVDGDKYVIEQWNRLEERLDKFLQGEMNNETK